MSADDLKLAVGCLSTVFPQFVAKELATLTDQIAAAIQGLTDPLAAIGNVHVDSLVDNVAAISEGDVMGNLKSAAEGLALQYTKREITDLLASMGSDDTSVSKRVQKIRNLTSNAQTLIGIEMSMVADMPYLVAQKMCNTIIEVDNLKIKNLTCLRKHIAQLVNAVLVLVKTANGMTDRTFADLDAALAFLSSANGDLGRSLLVLGGQTHFDTRAFERARQELQSAGALLTPDKDGTSLLDVVDILSSGSVSAGHLTRANQKLVLIVIPGLMTLIEAEVGAVMGHIRVVNFYVQQLGDLITNYRRVGISSQIQAQRARLIREAQARVVELMSRVQVAINRQSLRAASAEMLLWASRIKSILVAMDTVKDLTLKEGSLEGPDKAFVLEQKYRQLLASLTSLPDAGIEDPIALRNSVFALTKGARRLLKDVETGRVEPSHLATFHTQALAAAIGQTSQIDLSSSFASQQKTICGRFAAIDLKYAPRLDALLDGLRHMGLDRGVDLLMSGKFDDLHNISPDLLSYVGAAAECIKHALDATDDTQTRQKLNKIRTDLIAKRTNQEIAATDSADHGQLGFIDKLRSQMTTIQTNAKTIEAIVTDLKGALKAVGEGFEETVDGLQKFNAFLGNVDHLAVAAGGRLAAGLEEFSEHPNGGVVACELP